MERILVAVAVWYSLPVMIGMAVYVVRGIVDRLGDLEDRYRRKPAQIAK